MLRLNDQPVSVRTQYRNHIIQIFKLENRLTEEIVSKQLNGLLNTIMNYLQRVFFNKQDIEFIEFEELKLVLPSNFSKAIYVYLITFIMSTDCASITDFNYLTEVVVDYYKNTDDSANCYYIMENIPLELKNTLALLN